MVVSLSSYPSMVVCIACREYLRAGSYRLACLAEGYGAEKMMGELLILISADCAKRGVKRQGEHPLCGVLKLPPPCRACPGLRRGG